MTGERITDEALAELLRVTEEATTVFLRGDMERYLELTPHASGFTLANPFGGEPLVYDDRGESILAAADFFQGGEATIEVVRAHTWADTVVLVMIERQRAAVGGLPDQDWSLRVTQVYRRDGREWVVVHRHADPLVRPVGLEGASRLASGEHGAT